MGSSFSKPLPADHSHIRDSFVLSDGKCRLHDAMYAGSPCGRYIFAIGNSHITSVDSSSETAVSFQIDVVDMFLSKRTRIQSIGDIYNGGMPSGFYALSERQVVFVDYDTDNSTLRQRLIDIDLRLMKASCNFYRNYAIDGLTVSVLGQVHRPKTSTGNEWAVTVMPNKDAATCFMPLIDGSFQTGLVYPSNPLSTRPHIEIRQLIQDANAYVCRFYGNRWNGEGVSTLHPPFFISNYVLGFFMDKKRDDVIDPMTIVVMDLAAGTVRIRPARTSVEHRLSNHVLAPFRAQWTQSSIGEVALVYRSLELEMSFLSRYGRTGACVLLFGAVLPFVALGVLFEKWPPSSSILRRVESFCLNTSMRLLGQCIRLLPTSANKFCLFCPRSFQWKEIEDAGIDEDTILIPSKDGQFALSSTVNDFASSRTIGGCPAHKRMERFRLIGNSFRIPSLLRLSSIAAQKNRRVPREILEQIAARML